MGAPFRSSKVHGLSYLCIRSAGLPGEGPQRPLSLSQCHGGGHPLPPSTPPHPRLQLSHAVVTRTIKSRCGRYSAQGPLPPLERLILPPKMETMPYVGCGWGTNWNEASKVSEWTWHAWISISDSYCQQQWSQINTVVLMEGNVLALTQVRNSFTLRQVGRGKQLQPLHPAHGHEPVMPSWGVWGLPGRRV